MSIQLEVGTMVSNKKILAITIPLILQQLTHYLQTTVQQAMLGRIDPIYFSAMGNLRVLTFVFIMIGALDTGTIIWIAQSIGAKDTLQAQRYAESAFIGNAILSLIVFMCLFFGNQYVFRLMGLQSPVLEYSASYLKISSLGFLGLGLAPTFICIVQGLGNTKIIMYWALICNFLTILLSYIFILGNFGFPQMNLDGAAYASLISNVIGSSILLVYVFSNKKMPFKLNIKKISNFRWNLYKKIVTIGLPAGFENFVWEIGQLMIISFLNREDIKSTGIFTLIYTIQMVPACFNVGLSKTALTLVGQKTGEDDHKGAVVAGFRCLCFSMVICILMVLLFLFYPQRIIGLFTADESFIQDTIPCLILAGFILFPKAINNVIGFGIIGMGDTKWMLYMQILGCIFVVTLSYISIFIFNYSVFMIFIIILIEETLRSIVHLLRFLKGREFFFLKPFQKITKVQ